MLPVATVTLARLAFEQGDRELAAQTLAAVLAREPGNVGALELEAELAGQDAPAGARARTVVALQGWLGRFRLAAERVGR